MTGENGKCSFCGEIKLVSRKYLSAKNTKHIDTNKQTPFTITYYCNDCELDQGLTTLDQVIEKIAKETRKSSCCEGRLDLMFINRKLCVVCSKCQDEVAYQFE